MGPNVCVLVYMKLLARTLGPSAFGPIFFVSSGQRQSVDSGAFQRSLKGIVASKAPGRRPSAAVEKAKAALRARREQRRMQTATEYAVYFG